MRKQKVTIIAEAGVNHNGSLEYAYKLVDAAVDAGVDYVKFQTFKAENLVSKIARKADYQVEVRSGSETQFEMLKRLELSHEDHELLLSYCKEKGVAFFSTAFDLQSLEYLANIGLDLVKIPSGEITNLPYLRRAAQLFKNVIISTGMSTLVEIADAIDVFEKEGINRSNIIVLHCNTEYPTRMADVNLRAMLNIRDKFNVLVGYSDHTLGIEVPIAATALGAVMIEKHFTLDKTMEGPDHKASLDPDELKQMVQAIRNIEYALSGSGLKEPSISEMKNLAVARKSIHLKRQIPQGHMLTEDDLEMLRPGDGISPMEIDSVIGRKARVSLLKGAKLTKKDLE